MGRRSEVVPVPAGHGRDSEERKHFLITEWSARRADHWATRMLLALNRGGGDVNFDAMLGRGMEAIFFVGMQTFLRGQIQPDEVIPLLDELLECVEIIRDPSATDRTTGGPVAGPLVSDDDIEEIKTRWWLRSEVLRIHTGFSPQEIVQKWISAIMTPTAATSESTQQT